VDAPSIAQIVRHVSQQAPRNPTVPLATQLQLSRRVNDPVPAPEPRREDRPVTSPFGRTLLGIAPRELREAEAKLARGSQPLTADDGRAHQPPSVRDIAAPSPGVPSDQFDEHMEAWTHFDTLRPQAFEPRRLARTARVVVVVAVAVVALIAIGYLATMAFFGVSHSWIVPTTIAASDPRVVAVQRELATAEREAERVAGELAETRRAIAAFDAGAAAKPPRDLESHRRARARLIARDDTARASLTERKQQLAELKSSPYLRAATGGAVMALAPYGNLDEIAIGTPVHACRFQMVWCRRVGSVVDVLRGEITFQHPYRSRQLRGRMVELRVDDRTAAQADVLFVNGAPLWL
jgi:hypothetical protein